MGPATCRRRHCASGRGRSAGGSRPLAAASAVGIQPKKRRDARTVSHGCSSAELALAFSRVRERVRACAMGA
eukprot:scaffold26105_cov117-Phaeocystis_antarctica.AAC.1